jgi:hypothetical protein
MNIFNYTTLVLRTSTQGIYKRQKSTLFLLSSNLVTTTVSPPPSSLGWNHHTTAEAKSKMVDSGIGLPVVNVLESTLEWT